MNRLHPTAKILTNAQARPDRGCGIRAASIARRMTALASVALAACGGGNNDGATASSAVVTMASPAPTEVALGKGRFAGDTLPPTVAVDDAPTTTTTALAALAGTAVDDTDLRNVTWVSDRGGSGSAKLTGSGASVNWSIAQLALQSGVNKITVKATDRAGNVGSVTTAIWLDTATPPPPPADTSAPTLQITNGGAAAAGALTGLAGTAADNVALQGVAWSNSLGGNGAAVTQGTSTAVNWSVASLPLQVGTNVITLTATDAAGNKTTTTTTATVGAGPVDTAPTYPMAPQLSLASLTGALVKFEMPWNDTSTSLLNPAAAAPVPAGSAGPIVVKNGHFYVGANRIRLYGINMSLGALTPTHAEADAIAANLAKQGFNAVRIHGFDRPYIGRTYKQQGILNNDWTTLNPVAAELFDYFVAKLIQNGMYVKLMAHTGRRYPESPDCIERCEGIDNYMPALIDSHRKFLASVLGRVNLYTGRTYANEPGIFAVEINNENALTHRWRNGTIDTYVTDATLGPKYGVPLKQQWNAWLTAKYATPAALSAAWGTTIASIADVAVPLRTQATALGVARMTDWWKFIGATEESYWSGMQDYIKGPLGFKGLVSGGQMNYSPQFFKPKSDFTDVHYYWHGLPSIAGTYSAAGAPNDGYPIYATTNDLPQYVDADAKNTFIASMNRVNGRPQVISEYSVRHHNSYGAEAEMLMFAYALFQDWDGIFMFTYNDQNMVSPEKKQGYLFNDSIKKVTRAAATIMFRRADVSAGPTEKVYAISKERLFDRLAKGQSFSSAHYDLGGNVREPFRTRISHTVVDTLAQEQLPPSASFSGNDYNTDTNQLRWKGGVNFTIDTPKTQMRTSVPDGQATALGGGVSVTTGKTMLGRTLLTLTSLTDTQAIPAAPSMLLTVTGDDLTDYEWRSADRLQRVVGIGNNRLEAVPAQVTIQKGSIDTSKRLRVYALDDTGNVKLEVPVVDNGTTLSFVVGPGTNSPWYVIDQR